MKLNASSGRAFKDAIYEQFGRAGKALSSPRRIELLDLLSQGPRTVEALAGLTAQSVANTSHHLLVLHASGLVTSTKTGVFEIPCSELCGFGHSGMVGHLTVHTAEEYDKWVKEQWPSATAEAIPR